jgi:hypothetical protein
VPLLDHGGLGHDQAGTGTLSVIFGHQQGWYMIGSGPTPSQGGHDDTVGQFQGADPDGLKKSLHTTPLLIIFKMIIMAVGRQRLPYPCRWIDQKRFS